METAEDYAAATLRDRAAILRGWDVERALGRDEELLFGELASSELGGSVALVVLSGATSTVGAVDLRTPAALGLWVDRSPTALARLTRARQLEVQTVGHDGSLEDWSRGHGEAVVDDGPSAPESYLDAHPGSWFALDLTLSAPVDPAVVLHAGSVFQHRSPNGVQTLATALPYTATMPAGSMRAVRLPAFCLNEHLRPPRGHQMQPTGLVSSFAGLRTDQDAVWRHTRDLLDWTC